VLFVFPERSGVEADNFLLYGFSGNLFLYGSPLGMQLLKLRTGNIHRNALGLVICPKPIDPSLQLGQLAFQLSSEAAFLTRKALPFLLIGFRELLQKMRRFEMLLKASEDRLLDLVQVEDLAV
jgi:hypothetical protein